MDNMKQIEWAKKQRLVLGNSVEFNQGRLYYSFESMDPYVTEIMEPE